MTRKEFLEMLARCNAKTRKTTVATIGEAVSSNKVSYIKEEATCLEPDMTTRQVTLMETARCDCGRILSSKDNPLEGKCQHPGCLRYVCKSCAGICSRCGKTVCHLHYKRYSDGEVYCKKCRPVKWLKVWFDIEKKDGEK